MGLSDGAKKLIQKTANKMGYEIRRLPETPLEPLKELRLMVGPYHEPGQFQGAGKAQLQHCRDLCALKRNERVLDAGCGCGIFALAMTEYLDPHGSYEGFDIVPELVEWCIKNISRKHPNFHFRRVDVLNRHYNPTGAYKPSEFVFPYKSETFDFVFLNSVFTHMLPADMEHYFSEISRVLRPRGRCLVTFFVMNAESLLLLNAGQSDLDFRHLGKGYRTINENDPEEAVAYDEEVIRIVIQECRLTLVEPIHYGFWSGRKGGLSYQDFIIAQKAL